MLTGCVGMSLGGNTARLWLSAGSTSLFIESGGWFEFIGPNKGVFGETG